MKTKMRKFEYIYVYVWKFVIFVIFRYLILYYSVYLMMLCFTLICFFLSTNGVVFYRQKINCKQLSSYMHMG